ncbi:heavy-metal-associated domain-containing protein [Paracoccus rhizosphaerae]|uniref:Heavy-metal-associated domain-containing protein n=1 Tax=Paracoccus rhizosphaerae TaxID=1133347 RepID=A0ABV6CEF5_9RHOB|nr:heavy metal-associated domain-containing protein [Paracoccus rhizosphaerae]
MIQLSPSEEAMIFDVPDMTCGHCKAAVEKAVAAKEGQAQVDLDRKRVTVTGIDPDTARQAIIETGYSPTPAS